MARLPSKILIFLVFLGVYVYGIKGRPNNLEDVTAAAKGINLEGNNLVKKSKTKSGSQEKGQKSPRGNKKQVIDAFHLGPYHHGHPWGTVSQWPGYHWGGHVGHHGGWTGYPSLGGWHRSHIAKKGTKPSAHKAALKRHMKSTIAYPMYGLVYPSLGLAAVPFTPAPVAWGYGMYRSNIPEIRSQGFTRSSVKSPTANKRWWPGYMGGWGGWGIGNTGYPGWGPLGGDIWGHGFDLADPSHGWGVDIGGTYHPFLRAEIPGRNNDNENKADKRWWPGYMGGWGGWGLGNTGYPGWGPLGADWAYGFNPYGYGHGLGHFGYGYGLGPHGFGHRFGLGYGYGHGLGYRADIPDIKGEKAKEGPKRQFIHGPYGAIDYPWDDYGFASPYGPYGSFGSPLVGHGAYVPYPEALYGSYPPWGNAFNAYPFLNGFHSGHHFYKSKIPTGDSKKVNKEHKKDEGATGRNFVYNFHPGRYGWGGAMYPGHGYHSVFPLLEAFTYNGLYGGYYGPYGPPRGAFGPYHRSEIPDLQENANSRQVINYHPGCYGWGGCVYPGCGCIGGWTWPLPCHFHPLSHHCVPCWTRSKSPKAQNFKEEKGKARQEIIGADEDESDAKDPRTRPHLEGAEWLHQQMQSLAMGYPGVEKIQTPMGENNPAPQGYANQEVDENNQETPSDETADATTAQATPEEATVVAGQEEMGAVENSNDLGATVLGNAETGQQQSTSDIMSSFNMNPSEGEMPADSFGDTGNPNIPSMYGQASDGQTTEGASRRADIPSVDDGAVIKKQAVVYPYHYFYPSYMMPHGVTPYYHYTPINYAAAQHMMAYSSSYPMVHPYSTVGTQLPNHRSHSIHVGAPDVNIDVHTTREHVARNPEKQKTRKLKQMMGDFSRKMKGKSRKSSRGKRMHKRQISSILSAPIINRPMGLSPSQFRYPVSNTPGLLEQSMYSLPPQPLVQTQPFAVNAISRSGLPSMPSPALGSATTGLSVLRSPQMRPAFNPSQMAFSRQLSSITGISLPLSVQPGMGIVGMASRKKRSPSKKLPKKNSKSTKRQFLAGLPQSPQSAGFLPFGPLPGPLSGAGLPAFPTLPSPQMAFGSSAGAPEFPAKPPQPGLSAMRMGSLPAENIPGISAFSAFPSSPNSPFVKEPQLQNMNFFRGGTGSQWSPSPALKGGTGEGLLQSFEGNPRPLMPEIVQGGGGEPFQMNEMNGEQLAGFNPSSMVFGEQPRPSPMFSQESRASEGQGLFPMGPQKEMASFFNQLPTGGGIIESNDFNIQAGLTALKKSSVPTKKHGKGKKLKSRR